MDLILWWIIAMIYDLKLISNKNESLSKPAISHHGSPVCTSSGQIHRGFERTQVVAEIACRLRTDNFPGWGWWRPPRREHPRPRAAGSGPPLWWRPHQAPPGTRWVKTCGAPLLNCPWYSLVNYLYIEDYLMCYRVQISALLQLYIEFVKLYQNRSGNVNISWDVLSTFVLDVRPFSEQIRTSLFRVLLLPFLDLCRVSHGECIIIIILLDYWILVSWLQLSESWLMYIPRLHMTSQRDKKNGGTK